MSRTTIAKSTRGFSLVELMVATAVLAVVAGVLLTATNQASRLFQRTSGKIEQFGEARRAFESVSRRLADATLNTYWDYSYTTVGTNKVPSAYVRQSELRFRSGSMERLIPGSAVHRPTHGVFFQAPLGFVEDRQRLDSLDQTLNTWGFFVEIATDEEFQPLPLRGITPVRKRSRLLELQEPTERLSIYTANAALPAAWFADSIAAADRPVHVLAENIVALIVLPRLSRPDEIARGNRPTLCPAYEYDSTRTSNHTPPQNPPDGEINPKNQLPPTVQIVMVAIDEISGAKLAKEHPEDKDLGVQIDDLFQKSALLEDDPDSTTPGDGDLRKLEDRLLEKKLTWRVFSTNVAIRGAKWSKAQTN